MTNVFNKLGWVLAAMISLAVLAALGGLVFAGPLDPPGPPASSMKTLTEVEPRTPISSLPYTISSSGSYYLTGNLTGSTGSPGIFVVADDVTIDLGGFAVVGPGGTGGEDGIRGVAKNLTVRNGTVREWGGNGVLATCSSAGARIYNITARHNGFNGSSFTSETYGLYICSPGSVVDQCVIDSNGKPTGTLFTTGGLNVQNGTVSDCTSQGNYGCGFCVFTNSNITNCVSRSDVVGVFAFQSKVSGCRVTVCSAFTPASTDGLVIGNGNLIENNEISEPGCGGTVNGIRLTGSGNRLEGNNLSGVSPGSGVGIKEESGGNVVVRNSVQGWATKYSLTGDTAGPIESFSTPLTNPWANISY